MLIKLFDPSMKYLDSIRQEEVDIFLSSHNMTCLEKTDRNELIVFDSGLKKILIEIQKKELDYVVRRFINKNILIQDIERSLDIHGIAVFSPGHRSIRHFYNLAGFINAMNNISLLCENTSILIAPGVYGKIFLFGLKNIDRVEPLGLASHTTQA